MRRTSARLTQLRRHLDRVKWRDTQALEAYNTLILAQPTTKYVLCDYGRLLKEYYSDDHLKKMAHFANPFSFFAKRETDGALKKTGRELNRTVFCYGDDNVPSDRAYVVAISLADLIPTSEDK